uniref:Putative C globular stage n=1 Tax=Davidia involucrata TaxID=16924 RepID=A0A5B7CB13_DAVIN
MANPSADNVMEEREELMVSPTGGNPTLRTAHFLKPTLTSIKDLPSLPLSSKPTISQLKKTPLKVNFKGRRYPQKRWKTWVDRLLPIYQPIWKKVGIYEAILASTYQTLRHNDLILGLAERWRVETNTFVFHWGEATITLEDMMVLGGYSVLGDPVFSPLKTKDLIEIEENLGKAHKDFRPGSPRYASQCAWMDHFMETGGRFEHEAFLALWLSRYVFPRTYETVGRNVFPIAIHLSRGTPIALAPAVLASIYRDLSLLKKSIVSLTKWGTNYECVGDGLTVTLWAPFQLVQLWAWERFPTLRPKPNFIIRYGEPRSARWHRLKKVRVENVGMALDSARECFQWRPYAMDVKNWMFRKFYRENEDWVLVESDMDKELESFARCLRVCELVGIEDCIEQYFPHRVAMQFGMDQDFPGCVTRCNETREIAWRNYNRPITDAKLYIPPRLSESDVTTRYFEWWRQWMLAREDAIEGGIVLQQSSKTHKRSPQDFRGKEENDHAFVPQVPSKHIRVDKLTNAEMLRLDNKCNSFGDRPGGDDCQISSSSAADSAAAVGNMVSLMKPVDMSIIQGQTQTLMGRPMRDMEDVDGSKARSPTVSIIKNSEEESSSYGALEKPRLELEARISKLEKLVAGLKAAKYGHYRFPGKI